MNYDIEKEEHLSWFQVLSNLNKADTNTPGLFVWSHMSFEFEAKLISDPEPTKVSTDIKVALNHETPGIYSKYKFAHAGYIRLTSEVKGNHRIRLEMNLDS